MLKKKDFRPDRSGAGLLSHLHITYKQRRSLLKWSLYGLLLLAVSLLQDVALCRFRLYGATTELVPCVIFLIALLEGAENGSVFALISSLLYLFSGSAPGMYAMVIITFLAVGFTIFRQSYLQTGFGAALLCCALAMAVYELLIFAFGLFLGLTYPARLFGFLITWALSMPAVPILYPVVLSISGIGGETWKE